MNRRDFMKSTSLAAASVTTAGGLTTAVTAGVLPSPDGTSKAQTLAVMLPWSDDITGPGDLCMRVLRRIEVLSEGRLRFDVTLASDKTAQGASPSGRPISEPLQSGQADLQFGTEHDMVAHHPGFSYIAGLPGQQCLDPVSQLGWLEAGGGNALWADLAHDFGYHPITCGHLGANPPLWAIKPIRKPTDFADLSIYAPGLAANVASGMGAKPRAALSFADAAIAFQAKQIDGIEASGLYYAMQTGLHRTAPFANTASLIPHGSSLCVRIATPVWDALSPVDQALIKSAANEVALNSLTETRMHQDLIARALKEQHGIEFIAPMPETIKTITQVSRAMIAHAAGFDVTSRRLDRSYMAFKSALHPSPPPAFSEQAVS